MPAALLLPQYTISYYAVIIQHINLEIMSDLIHKISIVRLWKVSSLYILLVKIFV